ncbi:hypothetical protein [Desulfobulbus alkaliphilus]|uniref:hypothetical protein n=1 Tax=Desulfobulbus alkaliphilus TaxID=869814 RepID=UPI001966CE38|nr:hypothetical protein [Desulfobulbus alkaliphilus]MBM9538829.1 hypothetical protein [Desulfobulbus alkaliphilus]
MDFEFHNRICIKDATRGDFPKTVGVYAFINIGSGKIEYIGSATGKNGLRNRIWNQHLNSSSRFVLNPSEYVVP